MEANQSNLLLVFQRLLGRYGPQRWWPAEDPFEVAVGTILTQSAAWNNVERAIANLKRATALSPTALRHMPEEQLASLIRPCGYFNAKARKLKALAQFVGERLQDDLSRLRQWEPSSLRNALLSIYGIGPETADAIMLYVAGLPSFMVDAYTQRILHRIGMPPLQNSYPDYQDIFHRHLPRDPTLFKRIPRPASVRRQRDLPNGALVFIPLLG